MNNQELTFYEKLKYILSQYESNFYTTKKIPIDLKKEIIKIVLKELNSYQIKWEYKQYNQDEKLELLVAVFESPTINNMTTNIEKRGE